MKLFSSLAVAGLFLSTLAHADFRPNYERPIMGGQLREIIGTKPVTGRRAFYMTKNQRDNASEPTSFTMQEDTGIRCITAPCPSTRNVQFKITNITSSHRHDDLVTYEAIEVLKHIPPNVRIARRQLIVTESSMELAPPPGGNFSRRTVWDVQVRQFANQSIRYYANPQELMTTMEE